MEKSKKKWDENRIREDFPILRERTAEYPLIYLDNAATMQMPVCVMKRIQEHYLHDHANVHRGFYELSRRSTDSLEEARENIRILTGISDHDQIVFTSGTTASVNMAALMMESELMPDDEIVVTQMEHHSNFLPWQQLSKRTGAKFRIAKIQSDGTLDMENFVSLLSQRTKIVAVTQLSNVSGIENPISEISKIVREKTDAVLLVDGAQGFVHLGFRIPECDFYCFSGHKLGAPTGIGVLYMNEKMMRECTPVVYGGGAVYRVTEQEMFFRDGAERFEAGTPNFVGAIGLSEAMLFWNQYDVSELKKYEDSLLERFRENIEKYLSGQKDGKISIQFMGEKGQKHGCVSFYTPGISAFDFCSFMNQNGIAVRGGHHCAQPYLNALGFDTAVRVSVAPYNTMSEMDRAAECVVQAIQFFERMKKCGNGKYAEYRSRYHSRPD